MSAGESEFEVSVVIPAYQAETSLADAIDSVLRQTVVDIEIIVVVDGFVDATFEVAKAFCMRDNRVRVLRLHDSGRRYRRGVNINAGFEARNHALALARGVWIAFQDADDWSLRNRLEIQLSIAREWSLDLLTIQPFHAFPDRYQRATLSLDSFLDRGGDLTLDTLPSDLQRLASQSISRFSRAVPDWMFGGIPFAVKQSRLLSEFFYGDFTPFPGTGALVKRALAARFPFRPLNLRRWPSKKGRGADRDFYFQVASSGARTGHANIPLYAWVTPTEFQGNWDMNGLLQVDDSPGFEVRKES